MHERTVRVSGVGACRRTSQTPLRGREGGSRGRELCCTGFVPGDYLGCVQVKGEPYARIRTDRGLLHVYVHKSGRGNGLA